MHFTKPIKTGWLRVDSIEVTALDDQRLDDQRLDDQRLDDQRLVTRTSPSARGLRLVTIALIMTGVPFGANIAGRNVAMYDLALVLVSVTAIFFGAIQFVNARRTSFISSAPGSAFPRGVYPGAVACVFALALTSVVNPSSRSVENFFTMLGAGVLASQVSTAVARGKAYLLVRASAAFVLVQFIIATGQLLNGGSIGGPWLGETNGGFRPIAGVMAPAGSLIHANALGSVTAVMTVLFLGLRTIPTLRRTETLVCSAGATLSATLAVLSLTRSSMLTVAIAIVVAALSTNRRRLAPTIASILAFGVAAALLRSDAWIERGKSSVGGVEVAGSGRIALVRQAIAIFKLEPIFGVGPGNYMFTIRNDSIIAKLSTESVPVHNVWLFVLATTGIVGVCALTWLCIDILRRASRGGFWTIGLMVALVPPLLLDAAPFMGCGLAWTAAAIGTILGLSQRSGFESSRSENPPHSDTERHELSHSRNTLPVRGLFLTVVLFSGLACAPLQAAPTTRSKKVTNRAKSNTRPIRSKRRSTTKRLPAKPLPNSTVSPTSNPSRATSGATGESPSLAGCPIFPADNPWNQSVTNLPVHPMSDTWVASVSSSRSKLHPDVGSNPEYGLPFVITAADQPLVPVRYTDYGDESDPGPFPVPPTAPIEGGPRATGDRHVIVLQQGSCKLIELFGATKTSSGWDASSGAAFNLRTNDLRPKGWTSADAAGLPIFPGLMRFDEVRAGEIRHALRFTASRTQRGFIAPARHFAGRDDPNLPPMGARFRLKANTDISRFTGDAQVILEALKTYGMLLADNGSSWFISGATDPRWDDEDLGQLKSVPGDWFEVVDTGPIER